MIKLNKQILVNLIDEVVFPFHQYLDELDFTKTYLDTEEKMFKHKFDTAVLAVAVIRNPKFAKEEFEKASVAHNDFEVGYEAMKKTLNVFFKLMSQFLSKEEICKEFSLRIEEYNQFFMNAYVPKEESKFEEEDDFFDFDSDCVDEEMNKMHFEDRDKISAEEFMKDEVVDEHDIADVSDILEEFENESSHLETITDEYMEEFKKAISKFVAVFNSSYEFRNMAYSLEKLTSDLLFVDFENLEEEQKTIFKLLLDSIIEDLEKFHLNVLVEQTAIDIHYLDASLLANISQIEIILNQLKGE